MIMDDNMKLSDAEWRKELSPEEYRVLRGKGTEAPFTGKYLENHADGIYRCRACGNELFSSANKFDSGTGWPSFADVVKSGMVKLQDDASRGPVRTEVLCAKCGSHLGHLFGDGPKEMGGKRYCINSVCLAFDEGGEKKYNGKDGGGKESAAK